MWEVFFERRPECPYWLEQAHPETRYVDAKGNPQRLAGSGNNVSGGWPGMCLDWEPVREAAGRFIREMAKVVAPHPSMYAYDIWNESHIEPAWQRNIWTTPQERLYRRAKDIHENRDYSLDQNAIKITVPFQSVSVLLLE